MPEVTKYSIQSSTLQDIADAIREKTESSDPIAVSNFAEQIANISGGGDANYEELTIAEYNALTEEEKNNGTIYFVEDAIPGWKGVNPPDLSQVSKSASLVYETATEITSIGGWYCVVALTGSVALSPYAYILDSNNKNYLSASQSPSNQWVRASTAWLYFPIGSKFYVRAKFNDTDIPNTGTSSGLYYAPCLDTVIPDSSSNKVYSTSEKAVGTWIDGSTVYEKTLTFTISDFHNSGDMSSSRMNGQLWLDQDYDNAWIQDGWLLYKNAPYDNATMFSTPLNYAGASGNYIRSNIQKTSGVNDDKPYIYCDITYSASAYYRVRNNLIFIYIIRYTKAVSS